MLKTLCTALTVLSLAFATPAAAQLSEAEAEIVAAVENGFERDVSALEAITNVNSGTHNHAGVLQVAEMLMPAFAELGFDVEWIDQSDAGRAGHLFARHAGDPDAPNILMIGHIDTVFEPGSPFQAFSRDGDIATGPGVGDNKGGVIVILSALRAMQAAGTLEGANITVALTGDEEDAGEPLELARADLLAAGEWADVALGFEGLSVIGGRDYGVVARRGSDRWLLTVEGRSGHSSGIFRENAGYGAIYEMARILDRFRSELPEENLTFNVGLLVGGTPAQLDDSQLAGDAEGKTNIIPSTAIARGDLRALTPDQRDRVVAAMQEIVADHLPGTSATLEYEVRYPPMAPTHGNREMLAQLNAINADLGLEAMEEFPPSRRVAADISFVAPLVDHALAGMGPNGSGNHAEGESVDLTSIVRQAQRAAILMSRLTHAERE